MEEKNKSNGIEITLTFGGFFNALLIGLGLVWLFSMADDYLFEPRFESRVVMLRVTPDLIDSLAGLDADSLIVSIGTYRDPFDPNKEHKQIIAAYYHSDGSLIPGLSSGKYALSYRNDRLYYYEPRSRLREFIDWLSDSPPVEIDITEFAKITESTIEHEI